MLDVVLGQLYLVTVLALLVGRMAASTRAPANPTRGGQGDGGATIGASSAAPPAATKSSRASSRTRSMIISFARSGFSRIHAVTSKRPRDSCRRCRVCFTHSLRTSSRSCEPLGESLHLFVGDLDVEHGAEERQEVGAVVVTGRREHAGNDVRRVLHVDEHLEEGRVRHPAHALRDLAPASLRVAEPLGCLDDQPGPEARDAVVVMRDHDVAHALALLGRRRFPLADVVEDADQLAVRRRSRSSRRTCSFHWLKCGVPIQIA